MIRQGERFAFSADSADPQREFLHRPNIYRRFSGCESLGTLSLLASISGWHGDLEMISLDCDSSIDLREVAPEDALEHRGFLRLSWGSGNI